MLTCNNFFINLYTKLKIIDYLTRIVFCLRFEKKVEKGWEPHGARGNTVRKRSEVWGKGQMHEGLGVVQGTRGKSLRSQGLRVVHGASGISLRKRPDFWGLGIVHGSSGKDSKVGVLGKGLRALVLFMVRLEKVWGLGGKGLRPWCCSWC